VDHDRHQIESRQPFIRLVQPPRREYLRLGSMQGAIRSLASIVPINQRTLLCEAHRSKALRHP
jgi:hypothetical protein